MLTGVVHSRGTYCIRMHPQNSFTRVCVLCRNPRSPDVTCITPVGNRRTLMRRARRAQVNMLAVICGENSTLIFIHAAGPNSKRLATLMYVLTRDRRRTEGRHHIAILHLPAMSKSASPSCVDIPSLATYTCRYVRQVRLYIDKTPTTGPGFHWQTRLPDDQCNGAGRRVLSRTEYEVRADCRRG